MNASQKTALLELARSAIESTFTGDEQSLIAQMRRLKGGLYEQQCGCFVTLRDVNDALRGCIGNLIGRGNVVQSVVALAREAAFSDHRFVALKPRELDHLIIEISLLTPLEPIDDYRLIEIGRDGVILTCGNRRAVFLPQVATEQGWDLSTMLTHLSMKAGLAPKAYTEAECRFEVFQAEVFSDDDHL